MTDISTIREWQQDGFAELASDLGQRAASSLHVCDELNTIAIGLDPMVSDAIARVRARYHACARNMAEEAEVVSAARNCIGQLPAPMLLLKNDMAALEVDVERAGGVLNDDGSITWGSNPFPYDIRLQRLVPEQRARNLMKHAKELDSATGRVLGKLSEVELEISDFDIDPIKKNAIEADLRKLNRAGGATLELESAMSEEQAEIDQRIRGGLPLWNGMKSASDFSAFVGWLDTRRSARSELLWGLVGTLVVTQRAFGAMEFRNTARLGG